MHTITKLRMLQFPKVIAGPTLANAANMATKVCSVYHPLNIISYLNLEKTPPYKKGVRKKIR